MTFDEYRRHFETFAKIDTPEKLAICEQQYRSYVQAVESYSHFEPLEENPDEGNMSSRYNQKLYSAINFNDIKPNQILFLIQPSFEPESLLAIEKTCDIYTLVYTVLDKNYWHQIYSNNSGHHAKMMKTNGHLSKALGDRLFDLIDQCLIEAKKPQSGILVLDGVKYKISKIVGEFRKDVLKHSPDENSKTGKVINLLEAICALTGGDASQDDESKIALLLDRIQ